MELEVSHLVTVRVRVRLRVRLVLGARGEPPAEHRHREEYLVECAVAAHDLDAPAQDRDCG